MNKAVLFSLLFCFFLCTDARSQTDKIPLEQIETMFSSMKSSGINTDTTLLWGYFFTSSKKDRFTEVADSLKLKGFQFVKIFRPDKASYYLHLERAEVHNAASLFQLDEELYAIAAKFKVRYDGFDVGNLDKTKPLQSKPAAGAAD